MYVFHAYGAHSDKRARDRQRIRRANLSAENTADARLLFGNNKWRSLVDAKHAVKPAGIPDFANLPGALRRF